MSRQKILSEVSALIGDVRNKTHGDPQTNLSHATALKDVLRNSPRFHELEPAEREALEQIMTKASRLCCGNHDIDSWKDIAGYAAIGAEARERHVAFQERNAADDRLDAAYGVTRAVQHGTVTGRFIKKRKRK